MLKTVIFFLFAASSLFAGAISGTVFDPSGAVVPNANVWLLNLDSGIRQMGVTNAQGDYSFTSLPDGRYQVEVGKPGFALARDVSSLRNPDANLQVDVLLQLGSVRESVAIAGAHASAVSSAPPRRIRVGGNVQPAKLVRQVPPQYPEGAQVNGTVLIRGVILMNGTLGGLMVLSAPDPALANAAVEALRQWQYQPTLLNGQPVETATTVNVDFQPSR
jgi:TonB family protein